MRFAKRGGRTRSKVERGVRLQPRSGKHGRLGGKGSQFQLFAIGRDRDRESLLIMHDMQVRRIAQSDRSCMFTLHYIPQLQL